MPISVACPSCGGKLRVPDALCGQRVRCPACQHTFDSPAEPDPPPASPPAPQDLPLDLTLGEPSPPPTSPDVTPGLIGAIELKRTTDEPTPPEPPQQPPPRKPRLRLDQDLPDIRLSRPRRDSEPDRGAAVLSLGIISLVLIFIWCTAPVGAILGLIAWIMGQKDLRKMKSGQMDDKNRGLTQAGWICGILGTIVHGLIILTCGFFIGTVWYSEINRLPNTHPIPVTRPARPMPPKRAFPPRNNPPDRPF